MNFLSGGGDSEGSAPRTDFHTSQLQQPENPQIGIATISEADSADGHMPLIRIPSIWSAPIMHILFASTIAYLAILVNGSDMKHISWRERAACPDYAVYAARPHPPYSDGVYGLPFQRPVEECRLFKSEAVEELIQKMTWKLADPDLARLFENAFPNTLDTTVKWHVPGDASTAQSFIVTGDINAQWLRDSTNQLSQYQYLAKKDPALKKLILGAINTQVNFVLQSPYCNAFQPPKASRLQPSFNGQDDTVHPIYDNSVVFECKYEIDSLASFLSLGNQYFEQTGDHSFVHEKWLDALQNVLTLIEEQQASTFNWDGTTNHPVYTFQRRTSLGTETLNLGGIGNPIAANTSLIRSAFRPSDDAAIMQFFIPGNAFMATELKRTEKLVREAGHADLAETVREKGEEIEKAVWKHGVVQHAEFGKVFAYEVDGYGSHIIMDDANLPSLLALPLIGFVKLDDPVYQNTRNMILSLRGNPYFLKGRSFTGIGGPHIGLKNAWPMSLLVQIMTTDDDDEIKRLLEMVLKSSQLGLIHESVNINHISSYTRSWFAWANSVFAQAIFDLADRKPHLIFKQEADGS